MNDVGILPCDHCGEPATGRAHLFVDVTSHHPPLTADAAPTVARVRSRRHWIFCSDECRGEWWNVATDENFHDVTSHDPGGFVERDNHKDRHLRLVAWRVRPGAQTELHADEVFTTPHDLNAWWKTP